MLNVCSPKHLLPFTFIKSHLPKRLTVIHTLKAVAAMQGADQYHAQGHFGFQTREVEPATLQ